MATLELTSTTIEYDAFGPADCPRPAVVFVHGVAVDGGMWTEVARQLADLGYRSYVPTLPLGAHRIPAGAGTELTPHGLGRLIRDFVSELGLTAPTIVGCDTGGALCQFALDQDPGFAAASFSPTAMRSNSSHRNPSLRYSPC